MARTTTGPSSTGDRRRRVQSWLFGIAFIGLAAGTAVGVLLARRDSQRIHDLAPTIETEVSLPWFIGVGGGLAMVAMLLLVTVTHRHQRQMRQANQLLTQSEQRSRAVRDVAGQLARSLSAEEVVRALLDHLPAAVGAQSVVVAATTDDGPLTILGPGSVSSDGPLVPAPGSVVDGALARRDVAWLPSPLMWRGDTAADRLAAGGWAMALLPLTADDDVGLLAVVYPTVHTFDEDERALLATVGVLAARALARGRRYDHEHVAALAFQRAALPDELPVVAGLTIAARYRPGAVRASVGGDWYDVLVLDEQRVALVVGDVVGHGMEAAAAMGRLRTAFQTIAPLRPDPAAMVQAISQQAPSIADAMCTTVVCAILDRHTGTMRWCRAGHLPPVVLHAGVAMVVEGAGGPPLGMSRERPPVHEVVLAQDDLVVLYTDGMIERRGEAIYASLERLRVVAGELSDLEPEDFSDALVEAMVPAEEQVDDVAVLVVRFDGYPSVEPVGLSWPGAGS